jgi:predicted HNH restriction endonuclease
LGHIGVFRKFGTARLLAEIAKCDVLCANCHRKLHWQERSKIMNAKET